MDAMGNDNLNLQDKLSDSIVADDENEELRCLGTMRTDANFNGLHEEFSAAAGFHHSQFPDAPVSFSYPNFSGSFSDSISYTDIDWSFDGSRLGLSSQNWSHSILTNAKSKTNAPFNVGTQEVPSICRVPVRADQGLRIIGRDIETNNHNLQSSGRGEKIDLNITAIRSGFQPNSLDKLDSETLKATMPINKADNTSGFKHNTGDLPNISPFSENSVGVRCSNFINFSLHPSSVFHPSIIVGDENPFPTPKNEDDLNAAVVGQSNEDIPKSPWTASSNSQIELSSRSWLTDLEPCVLRRDQSQQHSEYQSYIDARNCSSECSNFAPSLGIFATISVPDRSFELHQSTEPSQPPQNVGNAPTSGNHNEREVGTVEDSGLTQSHPHRVLSVSASPDTSTQVSIQPQPTKIDPDLRKQEPILQPIIRDCLPPFPSKFEDLRVSSLRRARNSHCYIKCQDLDLDQNLELSGERCFLCKRDLSFKPEGSLVLPKILPAVAVLPCRHVFHDLCLERITPQDQSEDPPCIPCAVGET